MLCGGRDGASRRRIRREKDVTKRRAVILSVILAALLLACGGGTALAATWTQPVAPGSKAKVPFVVVQGDSANAIGDRLQAQGLIRNSTAFKALARLRGLDRALKPGTYELSPGKSTDEILGTLLAGNPDPGVTIAVGPGLRVTQYPALFAGKLANFNADTFMRIATSGVEPDGTDLSKKYWYVMSPQKAKGVKVALEGYLFPETYTFGSNDDETKVVEKLLDQFGFELCPGPGALPAANSYFHDKAACKAHAAVVNPATKQTLFNAIEKLYFTTDDTLALYRATILASFAIREIDDHADAPGVAGVYYNRYLVSEGKLSSPPNDFVGYMGSDPSSQYARDSDTPPADGKWWKPLADAGRRIAPNNPYNTEVVTHRGLPPGPIAAPTWAEMLAAANPKTSPLYFYFISDGCTTAKIHYAYSYAEAQANNAKWLYKCPAS